ncbi:hypothetical protein ACPPVO_08215 [Dactylosporangium sp. McL0621]|uniref:hypothetical protein n=1 Tax=Dactylosporangium sp. McL0621 TaxID=3415678 RepID=UPI003CE83B24
MTIDLPARAYDSGYANGWADGVDEGMRLAFDPVRRAVGRMQGRLDAARVEHRRAVRDGRLADAARHSAAVSRRAAALDRLDDAMDADE